MDDRRNFLKLFAGAGVSSSVVMATGAFGTVEKPPDRKRFPDLVPGGRYMMDVQDHLVYDRVVFPGGQPLPARWPCFVEELGRCQPGTFNVRTLLDTNVLRARSFPPPTSMLVERIVLMFDPDANPQDVAGVVRSYWFEFMVGQKVKARAPVLRRPATGRLDFLVDVKLPHSRMRRPDAIPPEVCWHLQNPVVIQPMEYFAFDLYADRSPDTIVPMFHPKGDVSVYCCLDGQGCFSVQ